MPSVRSFARYAPAMVAHGRESVPSLAKLYRDFRRDWEIEPIPAVWYRVKLPSERALAEECGVLHHGAAHDSDPPRARATRVRPTRRRTPRA